MGGILQRKVMAAGNSEGIALFHSPFATCGELTQVHFAALLPLTVYNRFSEQKEHKFCSIRYHS